VPQTETSEESQITASASPGQGATPWHRLPDVFALTSKAGDASSSKHNGYDVQDLPSLASS